MFSLRGMGAGDGMGDGDVMGCVRVDGMGCDGGPHLF